MNPEQVARVKRQREEALRHLRSIVAAQPAPKKGEKPRPEVEAARTFLREIEED